MKTRQIVMSLLAAAALTACQQKPYPIFFLTEESTVDGNTSKMIIMHNGKPYTRMPALSHKHIASYKSFLAKDGSYGVEFTFKPEMRRRLYAISLEKAGMQILPVVNGLAFQPVRIDRPVTDGKLVIWGGLNGYDLKEIARDITPIDEELEKKRFLDKNPRPIPKLQKDKMKTQKDYTGRVLSELFSGES